MKPQEFPDHIQPYLIPKVGGRVVYCCLGCEKEYGIDRLLYTCPACGSILLLADLAFDRLKKTPRDIWRQIFDYRRMLNMPALKGIYRYHEFIGPVMSLDSVIWLGEGHTPMVEANGYLQDLVGRRFYFKNDGQNPSASFSRESCQTCWPSVPLRGTPRPQQPFTPPIFNPRQNRQCFFRTRRSHPSNWHNPLEVAPWCLKSPASLMTA
jgi:hypothetical protein